MIHLLLLHTVSTNHSHGLNRTVEAAGEGKSRTTKAKKSSSQTSQSPDKVKQTTETQERKLEVYEKPGLWKFLCTICMQVRTMSHRFIVYLVYSTLSQSLSFCVCCLLSLASLVITMILFLFSISQTLWSCSPIRTQCIRE